MSKIVILGGGFGGIRCALDISRRLGSEAEVIIIDKHSYHTFTPALYEVASAYREKNEDSLKNLRRAVLIPYAEIFAGTRVKHLEGEIAYADVTERKIFLKNGKEIPYDYCVFALGGESTDFHVPGVAQYASFFKVVEDALRINAKLYSLFRGYYEGPRDKNIKILLAGAGFTGIELASEIAVCLHKLGRMHGISKKFFSVAIFEAAPEMLPMLKPSERKIIMDRLTKIGVAVYDHSPIEEIFTDHIKLADGHEWPADLIIWSAGFKPASVLERIDLPLTKHKKIDVDTNLKIKNSNHLFALGDNMEYLDPKTQQPAPALAYAAIEQAKIVAYNIEALVKNKQLKSYKIKPLAWAVPVGGKSALVQMTPSLWMSGFPGWLIRLWIDFRYFFSILPFKKALNLFKKDLVLFSKNDN